MMGVPIVIWEREGMTRCTTCQAVVEKPDELPVGSPYQAECPFRREGGSFEIDAVVLALVGGLSIRGRGGQLRREGASRTWKESNLVVLPRER
jgi:hypothetical protein